MASRGLTGSAVLAAAVFVGGTVGSPLVAPGEFPVRAGARRRRRGIETAAPLRPGLLAQNFWLSRGGPGWPRRVAWLRSVPSRPRGSRLPSSGRLLGGPVTPAPPRSCPGGRDPAWSVFLGCASSRQAPRSPANPFSAALVLRGPASGRSCQETGCAVVAPPPFYSLKPWGVSISSLSKC